MHEVRKTVTVLFADVVASTELGDRLDPESLRDVQSRYFAEMASIVERHGGTVEKFIGDEVMAVFGVPVLHEDDALRAVRAASAMQERLGQLNEELDARWGARLDIRIGINTGEVVAGDHTSGHGFVTGDAVNLAKRIEQAAEPGEILMGDPTYRLVRHAVETTHVGPLSLKGKRADVEPKRLDEVDLTSGPFAQSADAPLVGREAEGEALDAAYARAVETRSPQLVLVVGQAGIGKSRLARDLFERLRDEAVVLVGRCVPYGEGVTFWPMREIVGTEALEGSTVEIFGRIRKHLEARAREAPLVLCLEDVHWGEPTFLDLVQYLAGWIRDAPVLILCLARPDLLDRRPDWHATQPGTTVLELAALGSADSEHLLDLLGTPKDVRARITDAAEGNPLFIEQMAAMASDARGELVVPPSIRSLLAARLDGIDQDEAGVVERAAVIGRDFSLAAILDLMPDELRARTSALLLGLVRRGLMQPHASGDEDSFRFRHALIRDAAYDGVPKRVRSELHERYAAWLSANAADDVLVGYHLEQSVLLARQLGRRDEHVDELARRAGELVGRAGRRAARRGDVSAAVSLLERALALAGESAPLLDELGTALTRAGEFARAEDAVARASTAARAGGHRIVELRAAVQHQFIRSFASASREAAENARVAESVIPELERLDDQLGLAKAWWLLSETAVIEARWADRAEALERALEHARRASDARPEASAVAALLAQALYYGPTPAGEGVRRCRELIAEAGTDESLRAGVSVSLAGFLAMQGEVEEARTLYADAVALYDEFGLRFRRVSAAPIGADIDVRAGDTTAAERTLRDAYLTLEAMGERGVRSTLAACVADLLAQLRRDDEAESFAEIAESLAEEDDVATQVLWRSSLARVLGRRGDEGRAQDLATDALARAEGTDSPQLRAAAHLAQASALSSSDGAAARRHMHLAISTYRGKGDVAAAGLLERELGVAAPTE